MRNFSKLIAASTILMGISFAVAQAETIKITLLGVGDVYKFDAGKKRGGPSRLNAVAKAERAANPNFIYVFDGDML